MGSPRSIPWPALILLLGMIGLAHFNRISISVAGAESIIPKQGISETSMGLVYSSYLIVYTLAMSPGGWFSDRFGPRLALFIVGAGSALFLALTGLTGILWAGSQLMLGLMIVRGSMGLVNAPTHPAGAQFVGLWVPLWQRNLVNGLIGLAACTGVSLSYYVFGKLMDHFEWTGASMIVAAATLLMSLAWLLGMSPRRLQRSDPAKGSEHISTRHRRHAAETTYPWSLLLRNRTLVLLMLSYAAVNYFQYMFFYWAEYYFKMRGLDKDLSRLYSSILTMTMGVGMASGGWITDWVRRRRGSMAIVPVAGLLIGAAALVPGSVSSSAELALACIAVAMAAVGACEGSYWTTAVRVGGRRGALAAGILNTGGNAGGLLAPILTPMISSVFGWWAGLVLASVICILGAVCWAGIDADEVIGETGIP